MAVKRLNVSRKLEKELLQALLDPNDSIKRKRYIKKRIYGETTPKPIKLESKENSSQLTK